MFSPYFYWGLIIPLMIISPLLFYVLPNKENLSKIGLVNLINFIIGVMLSGWIGGLLAAVFTTYINTPSTVTYNWNNPSLWLEGQHWFGSFAFGTVYILNFSGFTSSKKGWIFLDSAALTVCLFYAFGKLACFLAGHNAGCSGSASNLPWAVMLPYKTYSVHPRQLYDALLHFIFFVFLLRIHTKYSNKQINVFFTFSIIHCCYSIFSDLLSENSIVKPGFTIGQLSFAFTAIYLIAFYYFKRTPTHKTHPSPQSD